MPYYEYECPACRCKFEIRQGMDDRKLVRCPKCKTEAERLISVVNHTFGWRLTERAHEIGGPKEEMERNI